MALRIAINSEGAGNSNVNDPPDGFITLEVATQKFAVSRATLKRHIEAGKIKSYRPKNAAKNNKHLVSYAEVAKIHSVR